MDDETKVRFALNAFPEGIVPPSAVAVANVMHIIDGKDAELKGARVVLTAYDELVDSLRAEIAALKGNGEEK